MKDFLPGWKTNINTVLMALGPILTMLGVAYDADATVALFEQLWGAIAALYMALMAAGVYFRGLADEK